MADITFAGDGTLYGWTEPSVDSLHTINLLTGHATLVGPSGIGANTFGSGIAATTDAIILAGRGGRNLVHRVSRTSGLATPIARLDWLPSAAIGALTFGPNNVLFGVGLPVGIGSTTILITINLLTGHVTEIGPTMPFGDAIAFDPPVFAPGPPEAIPTLSEVAFGVMAGLLAAIALYQMWRRGQLGSRA
jgi:hypothetical protein